MPTPNTTLWNHMSSIQDAAVKAMASVNRYRDNSSDMTNSAKATLLATVTTVPSVLQHASNCSICADWDGS